MCEEPKTPFPDDECGDRPCDEVVFGTRWIDINKGDETKPFHRSHLVVQVYKRQADWSFFTATPPLEALRSVLICATIDELPNEVGQPMAWTEPVVLILIDVRRAHFYSAARRKAFVELPAEASAGRLLRSMYGRRDAGVNWEFAFCEVMTAIGFVQGRASPRIHRHLEKQLHVWVHGDDFVPLGYFADVKWFFVKLQEFWVVTNRGILGPSGYHEHRAFGRLVEGTAEGVTWEADLPTC